MMSLRTTTSINDNGDNEGDNGDDDDDDDEILMKLWWHYDTDHGHGACDDNGHCWRR